jgi:hypothetical protein
MHNDISIKHSTPAENAMKQTSKTASELGDESVYENEDDDPVGPNDGPTIDHGKSVSEGDGQFANDESDAEATD